MNILLIQLPPWGIETIPLGLAYVAGALKGHDVDVLDANIALFHHAPELREVYLSQNTVFWEKEVLKYKRFFIDICKDKKYDYVGFNANRFSLPILEIMLPCFPGTIKIVGGPAAQDQNARQKIKADYFVVGEAEEIIANIIDGSEQGVAEYNHKVVIPKKKPDLTVIPDFSKFPLSLYTDTKGIPISFSRGCIRKCAFCSDWATTSPYRSRNAESVIIEMKENSKIFGRKVFSATDLLINGNIPFLDNFSGSLIDQKLKFSWSGQATIRQEMTQPLLEKMRFSGCTFLSYGVESLSDNVLSLMSKGYSSKTAKQVIKNTREAGIEVGVNIVVGFPGESDADIEETLTGLSEIGQYIDTINSLNLCTINAGSVLDIKSSEFGIISGKNKLGMEWEDRHGSNIGVRLRRYGRIMKAAKALGLSPRWSNAPGF
ncbi:MAG: radical SAM protein [Nanoarchaeota archaeon]|nr:radical SAM protein [Nanoarchaeota archaeon]